MKIGSLSAALLALAAAACSAGDSADTAADADAVPAVSADEQALMDVSEYWAAHYNMGHPGMVASVYSEDAWFLGADGAMASGPAGIEAMLSRFADASPQIEITPEEWMVFGDQAVGWGAYAITMTPAEGAEPVSWGGTYMTRNAKIDGEWKIVGHIGNLTADPFEGFEFTTPDGDDPAEEGTMTALAEAYMTHFNLGHPSMVADLYTVDAMASFSRGGPLMGREAIAEALAGLTADNPQLTIHDVGTTDLGDGWAVDGGWYELSPAGGGDPYQVGGYLQLVRQVEDGSWQAHWVVANGFPPDEM